MNQSLAPRLLKGINAEYGRAEYPGSNTSGVRPLGKSVVILMDSCAETSSGGVMLPPEIIGQMNVASESGVIVACGVEAFSYFDDGTKWTDYKPLPGDRVFVEKYAGREIRGRDGRLYRLMTYTCVGGLEEPLEELESEDFKKKSFQIVGDGAGGVSEVVKPPRRKKG